MTAATAPRRPPMPPALPLVGHLPGVARNPLATFRAIAAAHPEVAALKLPPYRCILASHPDAVRHVLVDRQANYVKSPSYDGLRLALGQGLITANGETWKRHRRLAQPAFHRERLAALLRPMAEASAAQVARWEPLHSTVVDVHTAMMKLTLEIVSRTLLGDDLGPAAATISRALSAVVAFAYDYTNVPFHLPLSFPLPSHRRFRKAVADLDRIARDVIARRRLTGPRDDLLSMLMEARDEDSGDGLTDDELRDEVLTMLLAGHETTASALSFALALLARHPEWADRIRDEAGAAENLGGIERLGSLSATGLVIQEAMRLYPPVWIFDRLALEDDEVMGYHVPAGTIALVCPSVLHRDARFWDRPDAFDPERFLPERSAARPRHAYVPFTAGPRQCIGMHFALLEMTLVLATLLPRFRLHPTIAAVEPEPLITLRPKGGLPMRLEKLP